MPRAWPGSVEHPATVKMEFGVFRLAFQCHTDRAQKDGEQRLLTECTKYVPFRSTQSVECAVVRADVARNVARFGFDSMSAFAKLEPAPRGSRY